MRPPSSALRSAPVRRAKAAVEKFQEGDGARTQVARTLVDRMEPFGTRVFEFFQQHHQFATLQLGLDLRDRHAGDAQTKCCQHTQQHAGTAAHIAGRQNRMVFTVDVEWPGDGLARQIVQTRMMEQFRGVLRRACTRKVVG